MVYYRLTKTGMKILHPRSYRFVFVLAATFLAFLSFFFIFSIDTYPGEWLYGLDRASEDLQLLLTFDRLERAKKHLKYAEERLEESKALVEQEKFEYFERTIDEFEKEVKEARAEIEKARGEKNVVPLLEELSESSFKHEAALKNLAVKFPKAHPKIQPLLNFTEKNREVAVRELENLTGRPYS